MTRNQFPGNVVMEVVVSVLGPKNKFLLRFQFLLFADLNVRNRHSKSFGLFWLFSVFSKQQNK